MTLGLAALGLFFVTAVVWFRRAFQIRIPARPVAFAVSWSAAALLGVAAMATGSGSVPGAWGTALSVLLLYFLSTGKQSSRQTIGVGDEMPGFNALDADGNAFDAATLAGSPALIKFFRGHW